ncbi:MAG: type II toxin-antitoxin system VapC family toxin [Alphaproteobacteria bacterium]
MYLLDTNVISELRRPKPHGGVVAWLESVPDEHLHISAVTLGELQAGVEATREQDRTKAEEIEGWLELIAGTLNVLPMDGSAFRIWARLMYRRSDELIEDAMIAATAILHNLTVVTRNVRDFELLGVATVNPFASRPEGR